VVEEEEPVVLVLVCLSGLISTQISSGVDMEVLVLLQFLMKFQNQQEIVLQLVES